MTAVQAPGPEPLDVQAVAQRRPPRGAARSGGRFPIQLAEAVAGGPEGMGAGRDRRASPDLGGTESDAKAPAIGAAPTGFAAAPALAEALPPTPPPAPDPEVPAGAPAQGQAARTPAMALKSSPAATSEARDRPEDGGEAAIRPPAQDGRPDAAAGTQPAAEPASAPAPHPGHRGPESRDGPAAPAAPDAGAPVPVAAVPPPARRENSTPAPPATTAFRMEPAGRTAGPAPSGRAERAPAQAPEPAMPADVLVGRGAEGLEVTIAAATPDLRDRFRAATGDLEAELSAIGAEVDAIRVELRAELADGGGGAGADARDRGGDLSGGDLSGGEGPAGGQQGMDRIAEGEVGPAETARGEADAAARLELFDPAMGPTPDPEAPSDDTREADQGSGGSTDSRSGHGAGTEGHARDIERLRLLPGIAAAGPGGSRWGDDAFRPEPGGQQRIDRYA